MQRIVLLLALFLLAQPAQGAESRYTRHSFDTCPQVGSPEPGIVANRQCRGPDGQAVDWSADDDSSSVTFGTRPLDEALGVETFFEVLPTIEWRGPPGTPYAAIVRYRTGPSVGRLDRTRLVVYRLAPGGVSCIMAILSGGPRANETARTLADTRASRFRCGTDRRSRGP